MSNYLFQSQRLGFRNWKTSDLEPYAALCADPEVMEFFPKTYTLEDTRKSIKRYQTCFEKNGFCYFAVDLLDNQEFIGFIGMLDQDYKGLFPPFVDLGWRLKKSAWGKGYATEGAKACLEHGLNVLNIPELYAVAPLLNVKSQNVMKKIGMQLVQEFDHPSIDKSSPLNRCVLYKYKP